ncbi:hypothetical protein JW988_09000 [Candidatus Bathyarchaeota archaeon]|nr:hypothetical protein [Candidatus Bathyarchaeota archaeon]
MHKKIKVSMAAVAALILVVLAVNLAMAATFVANTSDIEANNLEAAEKINPDESVTVDESIIFDDGIVISPEQAEDTEQLKELTPESFEEAESSICPVRSRFILYTGNGVHVMWGAYGNGRFVGTDNLGNRCWGIYGKGVFAGFYDGEFFWGRYCNGIWKAQYLFGLNYSRGEYVLFPAPALTVDAAP